MKAFFIDTEAIRAQIDRYFDAVYRADIQTLRGIFLPNAAMYGYLGEDMLAGTPEPFLADIGSKPSMQSAGIDCRSVITHLHVTGNIASVTLLVDGFYGAATVEDHFHLIKADGQWRIACKTFTTR